MKVAVEKLFGSGLLDIKFNLKNSQRKKNNRKKLIDTITLIFGTQTLAENRILKRF